MHVWSRRAGLLHQVQSDRTRGGANVLNDALGKAMHALAGDAPRVGWIVMDNIACWADSDIPGAFFVNVSTSRRLPCPSNAPVFKASEQARPRIL